MYTILICILSDEEELTHHQVSELLEKGKEVEDRNVASSDLDDEDETNGESKLNQLKPNDDSKPVDENVKKDDASQMIQLPSRTVQLQGWNNPIPFRPFPLTKSTMHPTKIVDPDYGDVAYESVRNKKQFARVVSNDGGSLAPGAFDPSVSAESIIQRKARRNKGEASHRHPMSRTEKFDPKAEDVKTSQLKLRQFYDDDRVRIMVHDTEPNNDDDENGDDDESADTNKEGQLGACRAMEWEYGYYPTCNEFHSIDVSRPYDDPTEVAKPRPENSMMKITYINHGHYRDVFVIEDNPWIWPKEYKYEHLNRPNASFGVLDEDKVSERIAKAYRSAILKTFNWERKLDDEHREMVKYVKNHVSVLRFSSVSFLILSSSFHLCQR
jgi:uncharacterized protein YnzC (UPF0291/DUF896 family)